MPFVHLTFSSSEQKFRALFILKNCLFACLSVPFIAIMRRMYVKIAKKKKKMRKKWKKRETRVRKIRREIDR